ncbi:MAG: ABC transporter ATP-binding protein [Clostridia bacterium]|nr:ABC transporter ATP-binding protein [Clostridia bacterium]
MKQPIVQIKNLKKIIGKKVIIDGLTFDIYPGEVFGFLGPNGAGKTTTIRMMFGLASITEGEIYIKGLNIKKDYEAAISHVGGIVENPEMYNFMSGYKNLVHYARMHKGITRERIDQVIRLVGLEARIRDKVKTYSLGMRQRLGLAQALLHSPSLLILDEPTNGLDPAGIRELRDYFRKLAREENIAVFVSSHLLSEMELMCDRVGIIQNGKLIDIKTVNELLNNTVDKDTPVVFTVDPVSNAVDCISQLGIGHSGLNNETGTIQIVLDREKVPQVVAKFVQEGIKVYGVQTQSVSLEDKFLEMTGGNKIV